LTPDGLRKSFNYRNFMPEHVGEEITTRYDIDQREIAAGGYGKVYRARDKKFNDREVAVKKVAKLDEAKTAAFRKEVTIMKDLDHPNICKLLETYETPRFIFFVMELCGHEVFDRIIEAGSISEADTAGICRQVASALHYAHNRGVAHRDMKPENLCYAEDTPDSQVKVIDWGLGFFFGGSARMSSSVGSLTYAAPEVLEARASGSYSSACDLWSLGVVTYVMLCGKPPFWGNHSEQLRMMKKERYPMTDAPWTAISSDAKSLIKGLLKNNPKNRISIGKVLQHPWLRQTPAQRTDPEVSCQVLSNMRQFSNCSQFYSICVAAVARQLDHNSLNDIHKVFADLDTDGDGVLTLQEVKDGFRKAFGEDSEELKQVDEMYAKLDLDGSGTLDYTEFCAAGIGQRMSSQEHVLWAAFKTFDIDDGDGKITKDEIQKVLTNADVNKAWSQEVCEQVAKEVIERYDTDGDGSIDFDEWVNFMREIAVKKEAEESESVMDRRQRRLRDRLEIAEREKDLPKVYEALSEMHSPNRPRQTVPVCTTMCSSSTSKGKNTSHCAVM